MVDWTSLFCRFSSFDFTQPTIPFLPPSSSAIFLCIYYLHLNPSIKLLSVLSREQETKTKKTQSKQTMSWQTYADEHLMCEIDGQHLTAAAIIGHDGTIWAQSDTFPQFKPEEIEAIMNDFAELGSLAPTGLYLGGVKYVVIQGEPGIVIRGKKGSGGVTVKKTTLALIIGVYDEPMTPGQCNMIVERLGDYLIDQGL